jgi:hypothetical protein
MNVEVKGHISLEFHTEYKVVQSYSDEIIHIDKYNKLGLQLASI